ncbi:MAG TPA: cation:proton antiporter, partial [Nitrososphaera sp.]|nr:cation:proton antiporter [Nitrososphaera sp.]
MSVGIELVGDLGYLLLVCSGVGALAYILKQPMILGFLIAGILIGPFGPFGLIKDIEMLNNFTDVAIVLLLFGVGLTFPLSQLRAIGKIGTGIAVIEVLVMLAIGFGVGSALGWPFYDAMFLAAALSISSTAIIVKVLEEMGKMESSSAILMIGVLVIEDLVAILIISAMHSGIVSGSFELTEIMVTIGEIGLFIGGTIAAGVLIMPRIFALIAKLERYEITIMFALGTAFGLAFLSYQLGFSAATGAFLAGVIIAGSKFSEQISVMISPTREIFTA